MEVLDLGLTEETTLNYSSIGKRFGALFLDGLIVCILFMPVVIFNFMDLRNIYTTIFLYLAMLLYKPFMEYKYGATLGKMAVGIKVTTYTGEAITLQQSVLRSLFYIISYALSMITSVMVQSSGISMSTIIEYNAAMSSNPLNTLNSIISLVILIDYIPPFFDKQKRCIHDRMAKTVVINK
jgi:uncharacterized RDD family membrane protein YckC